MKLNVLNSIPDIKWPHRLVDNFFSENDLKWIKGYFEYGLQRLEDKYSMLFENGKMIESDAVTETLISHGILGENYTTNGFSVYVPFWDTTRVVDVIDDLWTEGYYAYDFVNDRNPRRKDLFSYLELNIYPPKLDYSWHTDANYKTLTGVVYVGDTGDGTTLRSGNKCITINWKDNRALMFMNCDEERRGKTRAQYKRIEESKNDPLIPLHRYDNFTDEIRYAVNFNMTHPKWAFNVLSVFNQRTQYLKGGGFFEDWKSVRDKSYRPFSPITLGLYDPKHGRKKQKDTK